MLRVAEDDDQFWLLNCCKRRLSATRSIPSCCPHFSPISKWTPPFKPKRNQRDSAHLLRFHDNNSMYQQNNLLETSRTISLFITIPCILPISCGATSRPHFSSARVIKPAVFFLSHLPRLPNRKHHVWAFSVFVLHSPSVVSL